MNVVTLLGRLTKDPEIRYAGETAVCNAMIAVDRPGKAGADKKTDFIRLVTFNKTAETFSKYMAKGKQVAVEGSIQTGSYKNQKGDTVYTTDVAVNRFHFVGSKGDNSSAPAQQGFAVPEGFEAVDSDIPF